MVYLVNLYWGLSITAAMKQYYRLLNTHTTHESLKDT